MDEKETWRPVVGWEGLYEVSDQGRVRRGDHILKPSIPSAAQPYPGVTLSRQGDPASRMHVHSLVLEAFVGPRPVGQVARHGVGGSADNAISNLCWGTVAENNADLVAHGTHWEARKVRCKRAHLLVGTNLKPSTASKGWRACVSCQTGHNEAKAGRSLIAGADAKYLELVLGGLLCD